MTLRHVNVFIRFICNVTFLSVGFACFGTLECFICNQNKVIPYNKSCSRFSVEVCTDLKVSFEAVFCLKDVVNAELRQTRVETFDVARLELVRVFLGNVDSESSCSN